MGELPPALSKYVTSASVQRTLSSLGGCADLGPMVPPQGWALQGLKAVEREGRKTTAVPQGQAGL